MKFTIGLMICVLAAFMLGLYLPWWGIAVAGFATGLIVPQSALRTFLTGFCGVFIVWGGLALWIDINNQQILSSRIAHLFPLGGNGWALVLLTALLGGIVAGTAALSGTHLRKLVRK